jgi:hypothetical protein
MTIEKVYSFIKDPNIHKDLNNSPIWKECFKTFDEIGEKKGILYEYTIKFNGLKPTQVTNIKEI